MQRSPVGTAVERQMLRQRDPRLVGIARAVCARTRTIVMRDGALMSNLEPALGRLRVLYPVNDAREARGRQGTHQHNQHRRLEADQPHGTAGTCGPAETCDRHRSWVSVVARTATPPPRRRAGAGRTGREIGPLVGRRPPGRDEHANRSHHQHDQAPQSRRIRCSGCRQKIADVTTTRLRVPPGGESRREQQEQAEKSEAERPALMINDTGQARVEVLERDDLPAAALQSADRLHVDSVWGAVIVAAPGHGALDLHPLANALGVAHFLEEILFETQTVVAVE